MSSSLYDMDNPENSGADAKLMREQRRVDQANRQAPTKAESKDSKKEK